MKFFKNKQLLVLIILFLFDLSITAQDTFIIRSALNNSLVLSLENKNIKANALVKTYDGKKTQQWVIVPSDDGRYFYLKSKASDFVLDVKNGGSSARTPVWAYALNRSNAQKWRRVPAGNGYFYIISKLGTYLDVKGGRNQSNTLVWTYILNRSNAQKWKFDPVDISLRTPTRCTLNDCSEISRGVLGYQRKGNDYVIYSASGEHFQVPTDTEARKVRDILFNHFQIDKYCILDNIIFPYYRKGAIISGPALGERCRPIDPNNLFVSKIRDGRWGINSITGRTVIVTTSKKKALKMICLMKGNRIRQICTFKNDESIAGSGNPRVLGYVRR